MDKHDACRRRLLGAALGAAGLALLQPVRALAAGTNPPGSTALGDRLFLVYGVGANVLVLRTDDGVLLVDGGQAASWRALRGQLRRIAPGARVHTLVNTHWHPEQTGLNVVVGRDGGRIIAQQKTRQRLSVAQYDPLTDRYRAPLPAAGRPAESFFERMAIVVGGEALALGHLLQAHTDGDCYVHLPAHNLVAVGDAVASGRDPELDWYGGGWLGGRIDALARLIALGDAGTRYLPAQGAVLGRADLQTQHDALAQLFTRMAELLRKGYSAEDMLQAQVLEGTGLGLRDPQRFVHDAFRGLWAHHNTLSHDIV